ncbi:hypothetical protein DRE_04880 [Drechslerella stenobrocha 248]|uniref:Uncharacterized protein n=1 Tax=Drechslerella stenobrocha 248 TaxID=1043628 RepID=W7I0W5_9PEZI|nr:hypothetical protein DRE_04880 [Drechslerella stenobrocha 248]
MLGLLRTRLFDSFSPIKLELPSLSADSSTTTTTTATTAPYDSLRDLDFDIYEFDGTHDDPARPSSFFGFDTYDWAFSFRESAKTKEKVVLEVSVERIPKESSIVYETCCLPVSPSTIVASPSTASEMTLVRGNPSSSSSTPSRGMETTDLISEEEQNMILAAIIASQCDDFDRQIPKHIREEMEHAEMIAALEESKELAKAAEQRAAATVATPPPTPARATTFGSIPPRNIASSSSSSSSRSLARSNSDIPWTNQEGVQVEGESEKQARFRELLQFHAIAAASVANAAARTGFSNITGNNEGTDYDWLG